MLRKLIYISLLFFALGCSEYQKVLKSTDLKYKYTKAVEYYEKGKYNKAYPLFDELLTLYRGTEKAADVYFYLAYTNFKLKDYILAAYHFKNFSQTFPSHEKAEETAFMVGYCYYLESPPYSLAQDYTYKAINEIQLFVNTHPTSEKLLESNKLIIELRRKLERKSFERAKLYYKTTYYQSAVVAFNSTLNDFPDTKYREEALFLRFQASFELAKNSIESKKLQRFIEAKTAYLEFVDKYPQSENSREADAKFALVLEQIENLKKQS
jgi:outer membrane protein assembly factor BamD